MQSEGIPVLMYHHVTNHPGDTVTVTPDVFAGQIECLAENGYRFLTCRELVGYVTGDQPVDEKAVLLTFDDGWLDYYINAFPVMERFRVKSTVFVITGRTDAASRVGCLIDTDSPVHETAKKQIQNGHAERVVLDWQTIHRMADSGLVSFYSHTVTHRRCAELADGELVRELKASKSVLERELGDVCDYLCWPYGNFDELTIQAALQAGYKAIFTTIDGFSQADSDPHRIKRIEVKDSIEWMKERLSLT